MKTASCIMLISTLFLVFVLVQGGKTVAAIISLPIQGDIIIDDNDVVTIEGIYDINGSILIEENGTLILRNAIVTFTETFSRQHNLTLQNPSHGKPRLLVFNSTIQSSNPLYDVLTYATANSTVEINHSTISSYLDAFDTSEVLISNSSLVTIQYGYGSSHVDVHNSTMQEWQNYASTTANVQDSHVMDLVLGSTSVNCSILGLKGGFFTHWNYLLDCNVVVLAGGLSPNITLIDTSVDGWRLAFYGASNTNVMNSTLGEFSLLTGTSIGMLDSTRSDYVYLSGFTLLRARNITIDQMQTYDSATATIDTCSVVNVQAYGSSSILANVTSFTSVHCYDSSIVGFLNSGYSNLVFHDNGAAMVGWNLDVHVIDQIGQDVASANVTAYFSNSTVVMSVLTDVTGWARVIIAEKLMNITGEFPFTNYLVQAKQGIYTNQTVLNITDNQQTTIQLPTIVSETHSIFFVLALATTTLICTGFGRKRKRKNL